METILPTLLGLLAPRVFRARLARCVEATESVACEAFGLAASRLGYPELLRGLPSEAPVRHPGRLLYGPAGPSAETSELALDRCLRVQPLHKLNLFLSLAASGRLEAHKAAAAPILRSAGDWTNRAKRGTLGGMSFVQDVAQFEQLRKQPKVFGADLASLLVLSTPEAVRQGHRSWQRKACSGLLGCGFGLDEVCRPGGTTPLHYAAAWGDSVLMDLLLQGIKDPQRALQVQDTYGRLPAHIAALGGYLHGEMRDQLLPVGEDRQDLWGRSADDLQKWRKEEPQSLPESSLPDHEKLDDLGWDIKPVDPAQLGLGRSMGAGRSMVNFVQSEQHLLDYVCQRKPCLFRPQSDVSGSSVTTWSRSEVLNHFGHLELRASAWWRMAQGSVCDQTLGGCLDSDPAQPEYAFETPSGAMLDRVLKTSPFFLRPEDYRKNLAFLALPQIAVGRALCGAPAHFHGAAYSMLHIGRKYWLLFPSAEAFYSDKPALQWLREDWGRYEGTILEVEQHANEAVLVPEGWGHLTLCLSDCVSTTYEFAHLSSLHG